MTLTHEFAGGFPTRETIDTLYDERDFQRACQAHLRTNEDGSNDINCGPSAPSGYEDNWIPRVPGRNWFAYFRFYGPTQAYFDRTWPLGDFERIG